MATHILTTGQEVRERFRLLVAPGRPVSRAVAVMPEAEDPHSPQFVAKQLDRTTITIAASCISCWLVPAALWIGELL